MTSMKSLTSLISLPCLSYLFLVFLLYLLYLIFSISLITPLSLYMSNINDNCNIHNIHDLYKIHWCSWLLTFQISKWLLKIHLCHTLTHCQTIEIFVMKYFTIDGVDNKHFLKGKTNPIFNDLLLIYFLTYNIPQRLRG